MKYFKVKAERTAQRYEISLKNFIKETDRNYLFEQVNNGNTLFEKEITFDETYFMNLVNKSDNDDKR